jgi:hypothetical protein
MQSSLGRVIPRIGCGLLAAVVGVGFTMYNVWKSEQLTVANSETTLDHVHEHVVDTFTERIVELPRASQLCGYQVASATNPRVTDVVTDGTGFSGTGTAVVTLDAQPQAGVVPPTPGPCTASFHYNYRITTRREGDTSIDETNLTEVMQFRPITVGATQQGTLQPGDSTLDNGAQFDDWGIRLTAGQAVTIVARGGAETTAPGQNLDVLVAVFDVRGNQLGLDDDSAGNFNARFVFTPPADGLYLIRVAPAVTGTHHGAYTLVTIAGANPAAT